MLLCSLKAPGTHLLAGTQPSGSSAPWNTAIKPEIVEEMQPDGETVVAKLTVVTHVEEGAPFHINETDLSSVA